MYRTVQTVCAAAPLSLSACANSGPVLMPNYDFGAGFSQGEWGYSSANLPDAGHGNPFGVQPAEFNQAVAGDRRGSTVRPDVNFNAAGNSEADHLVVKGL